MPTKAGSSSKKKILKDPQGGLTAAGRRHFKETEGANLKPGVKGVADTPEKRKRKGSFLRRHFANPNPGPLKDQKGQPTRHALSAHAWGEPVPSTPADVQKLARKGTELLEEYHAARDKVKAGDTNRKTQPKAKGRTRSAQAEAGSKTRKKS